MLNKLKISFVVIILLLIPYFVPFFIFIYIIMIILYLKIYYNSKNVEKNWYFWDAKIIELNQLSDYENTKEYFYDFILFFDNNKYKFDTFPEKFIKDKKIGDNIKVKYLITKKDKLYLLENDKVFKIPGKIVI